MFTPLTKTRDEVMQEAHGFEDTVVKFLNSKPHTNAALFGGRLLSAEAHAIIHNDAFGYNYARNLPDIVASFSRFVFFVDAKHSHNAHTNNHLVDIVALEAFTRWQQAMDRPVLLAFWHEDGRVGWSEINHYRAHIHTTTDKSDRGSVAGGYHLATCHCISLKNAIEQFVRVRKAAA